MSTPGPAPHIENDQYLGQVVAGKYKIEKLLAFGGMGRVYEGTQQPLGRKVAIKIMAPLQRNPEDEEVYSKRFFREASLLGRLAHPNTVVLHDYGQLTKYDNAYFLVMEFLEGRTLRAALRETQRLSLDRAVRVGKQIASALIDAHEAGVIHRDLKPPNIILVDRGGDPDFVKVVDFGLVKPIEDEDEDEITRDGTFVGSPLYMAPEQLTRQQTDVRSEIYSFGVMFFEMVTGRPPFIKSPGGTVGDILVQHVTAPIPPPSSFVPGLKMPNILEEMIFRCLQKEPDARFQTMREVVQVLETCDRALITGEWTGEGVFNPDTQRLSIAAAASNTSEATISATVPSSSNRGPLIAAVILILCVTLIAVVYLVTNSNETKTPEQTTPQASTTPPPETSATPAVVKPEAATPDVIEAAVVEPETAPPAVVEPETAPPAVVEPETAPPAVVEPAVVEPAVAPPVAVSFTSKVSAVSVYRGKERLGFTPFTMSFPRDQFSEEQPFKVSFKKTGCKAAQKSITTIEGDSLEVAATPSCRRRPKVPPSTDSSSSGGLNINTSR